MHRAGHQGITLAVIGVLALLLPLKLLLPVGGLIFLTEPLPDRDFAVPFLDHRGYSHTVLGAIVVATLAAGILFGFVTLTQSNETMAALYTSFGLAGSLPTLVAVVWIGIVAGFLTHFAGDVITVGEGRKYGVQPFAPFSRWECGIQLCRADDTRYNLGFLFVGVLILIVGVGFGTGIASLSPTV